MDMFFDKKNFTRKYADGRQRKGGKLYLKNERRLKAMSHVAHPTFARPLPSRLVSIRRMNKARHAEMLNRKEGDADVNDK